MRKGGGVALKVFQIKIFRKVEIVQYFVNIFRIINPLKFTSVEFPMVNGPISEEIKLFNVNKETCSRQSF